MLISTIILVGAIIGLAVMLGHEVMKGTSESDVCNTKECVQTATYFLEKMNFSADPCDDFHNYACGKWVENTRIPDDKGRYGIFDDLRDELAQTCIEALEMPVNETAPNAIGKARLFYQSCLDTDNISKDKGIKQLNDLLKLVNISSDLNNVVNLELYEVLPQIVQKFGLYFLLNFNVDVDDKNTAKNIITLDQQTSFLLSRNILVSDDQDNDRVKAYKKYIQDSLCLLKSEPEGCEEMKNITDEIYKFETDIAKQTRDQVERRSAWTWYYPMTIEELSKNISQIPFLSYIKDIMGPSEIAKNVTENTVVIVKEQTYFIKLAKLLTDTDNKTVSNYLAWRIIQSLGPGLFQEMRDFQFVFDKVDGGIKKPADNTLRCFDSTNSVFGHAVGRIYVDEKFEQSAKTDVEDMVKNLGNSFRKLVDNNDWMDSATKTASKAKIDLMYSLIGYPEWTKNNTLLDNYYKEETISKKDYYSNILNVLGLAVKRSIAQLPKSNNRSEDWVTPASIVNAFYSPSANSITFPAGILQIPFYGKRTKVLNYGAIGYVIGHEITHGYDDQGSQFDGEGNLKNWWTNETLQEFNKRKKCFIDQYSAIKDPLSGKNLNGEQTIGENIADNGGIRESYQAYLMSGRDTQRLPGLEEFSDLQLFYLSAATVWCTKFRKEAMENQIATGVHSPGMYRAYVPLANSVEFAEVFQCPKNTKMNPENRCVIW